MGLINCYEDKQKGQLHNGGICCFAGYNTCGCNIGARNNVFLQSDD